MPNASVAHFDFIELHFYNGTKRMKEAHLKYLYFMKKRNPYAYKQTWIVKPGILFQDLGYTKIGAALEME